MERCIQANRIVARPAYAEFESRSGYGNVVVLTTHRGKGLTFYRGQTRLTAEKALALLADPDLEATYAGLYKGLLRSGRARVNAGNWTAGIGFAVQAIGAAVMFASLAGIADEDSERRKQAGIVMYTGLGVMCLGGLVGSIGLLVRRAAVKDANTGEAFQTIFIAPELQPQLQRALHRYNRTVEARCGRRPAPAPPRAPSAPPAVPPGTTPIPPPAD